MGTYYHYVNHDKLQYFSGGMGHTNPKFSGLGFGIAGRALAILLSERGTWKGDRISLLGDDSPEFEDVYLRYLDIEVEAMLMLLDVDGLEWIEAELKELSSRFELACEIAIYLRRADVTRMLDRQFGSGNWQKRYAENLKGNTGNSHMLQKFAAASARQLATLLAPAK